MPKEPCWKRNAQGTALCLLHVIIAPQLKKNWTACLLPYASKSNICNALSPPILRVESLPDS
jgi:hypothetical protein